MLVGGDAAFRGVGDGVAEFGEQFGRGDVFIRGQHPVEYLPDFRGKVDRPTELLTEQRIQLSDFAVDGDQPGTESGKDPCHFHRGGFAFHEVLFEAVGPPFVLSFAALVPGLDFEPIQDHFPILNQAFGSIFTGGQVGQELQVQMA